MDTINKYSTAKSNLGRVMDAGIVISALLIGYFVGRNSVTAASPPARAANAPIGSRSALTDPIGKNISIAGVDFKSNQRTLVFVLQTTCRFCTDSGPFYQRLIRERAQFGGTRLLAVLPQAVQESKSYLAHLGITVDEVVQGSLQDIGVQGTPTLLLVNSSGVVTEAWSRKLPPAAEDAILARLRTRN